jgi:hypothetical protein
MSKKQEELDLSSAKPIPQDRIDALLSDVKDDLENVEGKLLNTLMQAAATHETPQKRFIALCKVKEAVIENLKRVGEQLDAAMAELGEGAWVQDPESLVVYHVTRPKIKVVVIPELEYLRTLAEGEEGRSDISEERVEAAGFVTKKMLAKRAEKAAKEAEKASKKKK